MATVKSLRCGLGLLIVLGLACPAVAGSGVFGQAGGGPWTTSTWVGGVPNGVGDVALFGPLYPTLTQTITLDDSITLGELRMSSSINNTFGLTITDPASANGITFANVDGPAAVWHSSAAQTLSIGAAGPPVQTPPVRLRGNLVVSLYNQNTYGSTILAIYGPITGADRNIELTGDASGNTALLLFGNNENWSGSLLVTRGNVMAKDRGLGTTAVTVRNASDGNNAGGRLTLNNAAVAGGVTWNNDIFLDSATGIRCNGALAGVGGTTSTVTGNVDLGGFGSYIAGDGNLTLAGIISGGPGNTGGLTKVTSDTLRITGNANTYIGRTLIGSHGSGGQLAYRDAGTDGATEYFSVYSGGTLSVDNSGGGNIVDDGGVTNNGRINHPVVLAGGSLVLTGAAAGSTEIIPFLQVIAGANTVTNTASGAGQCVLVLGNVPGRYMRNAGATVNFTGSLGADNQQIRISGQALDLIGAYATVGNDWADYWPVGVRAFDLYTSAPTDALYDDAPARADLNASGAVTYTNNVARNFNTDRKSVV